MYSSNLSVLLSDDFLRCEDGRLRFWGARGGENPSASCMRLGAGECEHDWFFLLKQMRCFRY